MSIIKAIKAWWKPEPSPKIRIRFDSKGYIVNVIYPNSMDVGILAQHVECYKIKIGQTKPIGGGLGGLGFNG